MNYKKLITLASIFCVAIQAQAQVREVLEAIKPKVAFDGTPILKKKSQIVQVGIGAPNNVATLLNVSSLLGGITTKGASSKMGPFFIDYEYFIKENLSLGVGFAYAEASQEYNIPFSIKKATASLKGGSILFSSSYHFYITDKLDPYAKGSIGATLWKGNYTYDNGTEAGDQVLPTPIAYRALIGLRYFVSPIIAPFGELSYGNLKFSAAIGVGIKLK